MSVKVTLKTLCLAAILAFPQIVISQTMNITITNLRSMNGKISVSLLLHEMSKLNKNAQMKLVNTDISCNSIVEFLKAKNIEIVGKQFEMIKEIV